LEVRTFVAAGTETTGNTLTTTTFYLISNPEMAKRVKEEVLEAQKRSPTPLRCQELQQLPYLVNDSPIQVYRSESNDATDGSNPGGSSVDIYVLNENGNWSRLNRLSNGVAGRLPRINPRDAITYKSYTIPAGTTVSMTTKLTHDNPTIFPNPQSYDPERWLVAPEERKRLEKYLQPFGKGSRACIGQQYVFQK
jgi:cytochrome P450